MSNTLPTPDSSGQEPANRIRSLARIHELTTELLYVEDISVFLRRIAESVRELFGFDRVSISTMDTIRGIFTDHALAGYSEQEEAELRQNESAFAVDEILSDFKESFKISKIAYYIPAEKQPSPPGDFVAVKDRKAASEPRKAPGMWHELDLLYFALNDRRGQMVGFLQVDYPKNGRIPSAETVSELELFARIAAVGIENFSTYRRAHDLMKENETKSENMLKILELTRSVLMVDDLDVVLRKIASAMASSFNYRKVGVSLFTEGQNEVMVHALSGYTKDEEALVRKTPILKDKVLEDIRDEFRVTNSGYYVPGESQMTQMEDFVFIENVENARKPRATPHSWHELDLLYFAIYDREGHIIGIIQLDYPVDGKIPTKDMMEAMEAYASIASIAIGNSSLFEDTNDAKSQVKMYLDLLTHDVGNFVNPINAYLELVIGTTSLTAVQHKYMSSALEATRSVSHLIRNVSRSAQMLEDQQSELVPRDLLKTLLQVSTDARSAFLSRRVNVKLNFPKTDVWVMADGLLDEVFYNLLSNSIKYDDHDEVTIDVDVEVLQENEKNIARVKVIDRGTGIPDDLKEKVFSRGFRQMAKADRPSLHKSKGAGMGLSLVKSLVDKYEGKIWVENRVYADHSMGSVFIVLLPVP